MRPGCGRAQKRLEADTRELRRGRARNGTARAEIAPQEDELRADVRRRRPGHSDTDMGGAIRPIRGVRRPDTAHARRPRRARAPQGDARPAGRAPRRGNRADNQRKRLHKRGGAQYKVRRQRRIELSRGGAFQILQAPDSLHRPGARRHRRNGRGYSGSPEN